jgi:hypothetical protein
MYYLKSKTILGFLGNNLENDVQLHPDIIVIRKNSPVFQRDYERIISNFLRNDRFRQIVLPVYDNAYNTIPQTGEPFDHQFRMRKPVNDTEKLVIYVRGSAL